MTEMRKIRNCQNIKEVVDWEVHEKSFVEVFGHAFILLNCQGCHECSLTHLALTGWVQAARAPPIECLPVRAVLTALPRQGGTHEDMIRDSSLKVSLVRSNDLRKLQNGCVNLRS